tara:strand:+ start:1861 stop:2199 length:339 start_codon:yes stop_codon:yes gene_type:complete
MVQKQKRLVGKMAGVKLASLEYKKIQEFVDKGAFLNVSDFIREAVRDKLEETRVVQLREVDYKTAKRDVIEYYKKHKESYPSDAALDLGLDLEMVYKIVKELVNEKRAEFIE